MILLNQTTNMEEINEMQNLDVFIKWIHQGNLVVYPTETLYALGADIWNKEAVDTVYIVKQRPRNQPLSIAVSSLSEVEDIADVTSSAMVLAQRFLPGPLTVVLQKRTENLAYLTGGGTAIAIRVPNHPLALSLLSMCGPLTCTSANLHQTLPPSSIIEIAKDFSSHASQLK